MKSKPPMNLKQLEEESYVPEKAISTDYRIYKKDEIVALYYIPNDKVVDWRVKNESENGTK